jgi:hypothetical protein
MPSPNKTMRAVRAARRGGVFYHFEWKDRFSFFI